MSENVTEQTIDQPAGEVYDVDLSTQPSLIKSWRELLRSIEASQAERITIGSAQRVLRAYPALRVQDLSKYNDEYHELLKQARAVLLQVIHDDPESLEVPGDKDLEENGELYRRIVFDWSILLDERETAWDCDHPNAHISLAVLSDVRVFLFGETGLAGHLAARGFTISTDDVRDAVLAAREARGE